MTVTGSTKTLRFGGLTMLRYAVVFYAGVMFGILIAGLAVRAASDGDES